MQRSTIVMFAIVSAALWTVVDQAVAEADVPHADRKIDFDTEIIPLLTRHGCNAGSCHGAAIGRGDFKLSLLGSSAANDYDAMVHALEGRRVNLFDADRSLLLRKPSEQTGHEGGLVLDEDSSAYALLRRWIEQGAFRSQSRELVALRVVPEDGRIDSLGDETAFEVRATFVDKMTGRSVESDVTDWTVLTPNDPDSVSIDRQNRRLTVERPGVHIVIARFMDRVLPMRLTAPIHPSDSASQEKVAQSNVHPIDRFVDRQLEHLGLPSSPPSDDHAFLRRITLDLCGRLPTLTETERFASDPATSKRDRVIDELLRSRETADYWALKWANILAIDAKQLQPQGARAYHRWLADRIDDDTSVREIVVDLLTAVGDGFHRGPVNFSRFGQSPGDLAEHVSEVFMGVRLRCANCHDHPLDHWTQDDYHGLSAIFAKVKRGRVVSVSQRGEVTHPVTKQAAVQRIPGTRFLQPGESGRDVFARWLASEDNPYLSRVTVNRIWGELMGRGLVEPVDDMRATNPATHPELLDWLADDFRRQGFKMKSIIATICKSAAYQRESKPVAGNESDAQFYSHALVRPLEAEVVADAIGDVTGVPLKLAGDTEGSAVNLTNNRVESRVLDLLGRCDRSSDCQSEGVSAASLTRALHMINGPLFQSRVSHPDGTLAKLLKSTDSNRRVLDEIVLLTLSRPDASASDFWKSELQQIPSNDSDSRRVFFEDLFWGILASDRFATNH